MIKKCITCEVDKDILFFSKRRVRKDGTQMYNSVCKLCHRAEAREAYRNNKDTYLPKILANKKKNYAIYREEMLVFLKTKSCFDCGTKDFRVLEFDHLRDKKYNISDKKSSRLSSLMEEINKCDVVCCNCHRIRTMKRANSYRVK